MKKQRVNQCWIFAHRGAPTEAFENTEYAFNKALAYDIDGIETDVQLSRDDIAVLWHDRFLNKVGLPEKRIGDYDFEELTSMVLPESNGSNSSNNRILSFTEFFSAYQRRCRLLIEIKNRDWDKNTGRHETNIRQCLDCDVLPKDQFDDPINFVSSFNLASLVYANEYAPGSPLILNTETDKTASAVNRIFENNSFLYGICMPIENLTYPVSKALRKQSKMLLTYTCNTEAQIIKALELHIDILISDYPQKASRLRTSWNGTSPA